MLVNQPSGRTMPDPFLSEIKYLGNANLDFIEVAVDAGTDVSNLVVTVYRANGNVRSSNNLSVLTPTTVNGYDVYLIQNGDATNFNGVGLSQAVSLSEGSTVYQFVSFSDTAGGVTATSGPASGLTSTDIGQAGAGSSLETQDQGGSYFVQTSPDPNNVTCFVAGTRIETSEGQVPVEKLAQGMDIRTLDGSLKPLKLVLKSRVTESELSRNTTLWPVRIHAGALGLNVPQRDVLVSRQHRMLVSSPISQRMFGQRKVLVSAVRLTALPGIYVEKPVGDIEYFHLLFDEHEVIFADGAPTESFFLGEEALKSLPTQSLKEIELIFRDVSLPVQLEDSKHLIPNGKRQARLVERHLKNQKSLLAAF
jgi:hypothetical protein